MPTDCSVLRTPTSPLRFGPVSYTHLMLVITFDPNNGDQPSTQKVNWSKDGAALTAPDPVPTNEGHSIEAVSYTHLDVYKRQI